MTEPLEPIKPIEPTPLTEKGPNLTNMIPTSTQITNIPMPTKERGQRSINITDLFITRWTPPWARPPSLPAYTWRSWVLNQPIAEAAREVLISMITGLEWKVSARDSDKKEELNATVKYYTKLLEHGGEYLGTDWGGFMEWMLGDLLDIPFGGATEVGRKGDDPKGRVVWLRPLDGGTLYPTLNADVPVVQYFQGYQAVPFPYYSIARCFFTPRPEIFREGWGMAPPEKIYFAMDMLSRGDKYYANLLLDVPPAGILDLGDMEQSSAEEWVNSFRNFIAGTTDAFRIPVLYEHSNEVKFLPFGKVPNDIMYDHITLRYAALICAAYGIQLNDIGLQTTSRGGDTLAGSIRASTQTHRTGVARIKQKVKFFIEKILPETLQFDWIDHDDDHNVAMGRARLASATAYNLLLTSGVFSPEEIRMQMLQEGLVSISVPNELPPDAKPMLPAPAGGRGGGSAKGAAPKNPGALGHGVPPQVGGEGKSFVGKSRSAEFDAFVKNAVTAITPIVLKNIYSIPDDDIIFSKSIIEDSLFSEALGLDKVLETFFSAKPLLSVDIKALFDNYSVDEETRQGLDASLQRDLNTIVARSVAKSLNDVLFEMAVQEIDETTLQAELSDGEESNVIYDPANILSEVKSRVAKSFDQFLYTYLQTWAPAPEPEPVEEKSETEVTVQKSEVVAPVAAPAPVPAPAPELHQTINLPTINVSLPERSSTVNITNETPDVMVQPKIDVHVPPSDIHADVHVAQPDIHVNVEKSDIPVPPIHITVPEPNVTVNVEPAKQEPPTVNVNVEPTPIQVKNTVNVPESKKSSGKKITIHKNADGSFSGESDDK